MSISMFCIFFFSSRRRHTRSLCDWSSDVCSSDLVWKQLSSTMPSDPFHFALGRDRKLVKPARKKRVLRLCTRRRAERPYQRDSKAIARNCRYGLHNFPSRAGLREYAGLLCTGDTNFARDSMDVYAPATTPHMSAKGMFALLLDDDRSEEHTSELQSHSDLVCRLLLEKKKKKENRETCNTKK